jgi:hypothetical protein
MTAPKHLDDTESFREACRRGANRISVKGLDETETTYEIREAVFECRHCGLRVGKLSTRPDATEALAPYLETHRRLCHD